MAFAIQDVILDDDSINGSSSSLNIGATPAASASQIDVDHHTSHRHDGTGRLSIHTIDAVTPFMAQHIPGSYNPTAGDVNTKYCNRHRPDLNCRRQIDEPTMAHLQADLASLSQIDKQAIATTWALFSAAPAKQRDLMLKGILTQCCFPQLSFLSSQICDLIKIDFLSALPTELGFKVLSFLDTASLCRAAQVSHRWRVLADDDVVWHNMCEQHIDRKCTACGWGLPLLDRERLKNEKSLIDLRARARGKLPASTGDTSTKRGCDDAPTKDAKRFRRNDTAPWKDVYKTRFRVGSNWKYGRCTVKKFVGHENGVMCIQMMDNILVTGSYDATVKIWNMETGQLIRTLRGHTSGVRCIQFDRDILMSGALDGSMRVWKWQTAELCRTLSAHEGGVITLHFTDKLIATGSTDKTIKIYGMFPHQTTPVNFRLRGHKDWVNCVKIDEPSLTLMSASDDFSVRMWDLVSRQCMRVFEGHAGQVQQVLLMPPEYEPAFCDNEDGKHSGQSTPRPVSMSEKTPRPSNVPPAPFWTADSKRAQPPRYMISAALDSTMRVWDIYAPTTAVPLSTGQGTVACPTVPRVNTHLYTMFGHVEGIWGLAADHLRLVSAAEDRMVKVWDPRTGRCERTFTGHTAPVTSVALSDSRLVSGSEDMEVRMLTFSDDFQTKDGTDHEATVPAH